jgi:hypothetical protein
MTLQADPTGLREPFGYDPNVLYMGFVAGADIPPFWETPMAPEAAVSFAPLPFSVSTPVTVTVEGSWVGTDYDVYSLDDHGSLEGPVGTAKVEGAQLIASDLTPSFLTWLLFVPAG